MDHKFIRMGITQGDPNGVGLEIIQKACTQESLMKQIIPVLYAAPRSYVYYKKLLAGTDFQAPVYTLVKTVEEAQPGRLNLLVSSDQMLEIEPGKASPQAGAEALASLKACVQDAAAGKLDAIVTAPLDKSTVAAGESGFTGHTGYIAAALGTSQHAMMLVSESLRIALATEHLPLSAVSAAISREGLLERIKLVHFSLQRDFAIGRPRIAVLGLNPHAGDSGLIGREENDLIKPAVADALAQDMLVYGPYSADAFFGSGNYRNFDAILAMYHDQGLIPFKAEAFYDGVNYTAGLPVVRTSPDHGTAYDLAGKGTASPASLIQAMLDAISIVRNREYYDTGKASFLPFAEMKRERFRIDF
jgi:4-hydroxythreonine-4-phosphate dehydrogenase